MRREFPSNDAVQEVQHDAACCTVQVASALEVKRVSEAAFVIA
ncbi:MAG: hypothetical protein U1C54_05285 [Xanthomonadaceae bacterium]|jgi:hypothetical protein|nr:hypothetical protein [Xanthomonadaceae bacterium]MDZ4379542.1 hypothetical protein [Xanthomonadaceae bacterium]